MSVETEVLNARISDLSTIEEVIELCRENNSELVSVSKVLTALIAEYNLTVSQFISKCSFSRSHKTSITSWLNGTSEPRTRTQYIKIAVGLGMTLQEANRFLMRVGGYHALYPKNIDDAGYIYLLLNHKNFSEFTDIKKEIEETLNQCILDYISETEPSIKTITKLELKKLRSFMLEKNKEFSSTQLMMDEFYNWGYKDIFSFVRNYWWEYFAAHYSLLDCIDQLVERASYVDEYDHHNIDTLYKITREAVFDGIISTNTKNSIDSSYSDLKTLGKLPSREILITLAMILQQDLDSINNLLDIAGMEPLCAKRGIEAALRFALNKYTFNRHIKLADIKDELITFSSFYQDMSLPRLIELLFSEEELEEDF